MLANPLLNFGILRTCRLSNNRMIESKYGISSQNLKRIVMAGELSIQCFDKTGTLTKDGLELYGIRPCVNVNSGNAVGLSSSQSSGSE